jgi:hypothetical protein
MSKKQRLRWARRLNRIATRPLRRKNRDYTVKSALSENWEVTPEGFLIVPVVVAKKMVLDYPEYGTRELVGDAIFSKEFLASCDGCPFVLEHPVNESGRSVDVLPDNFDEFVKGVLIEPRAERENDRVVGKIKVWDKDVIEKIKSRELRELSQGYRCVVIDSPGVYRGERYDAVQTEIIMNHIALVEEGRAGSEVAVMNSKKWREATKKLMEENMVKNKRRNMDEQTTEAGRPNPQNADGEIETEEQQEEEDARLAAIEEKLEILAQAIAKLTGAQNSEQERQENEEHDGKEGQQTANAEEQTAENPRPEEKANEEEKLMNRVTNALTKRIPEIIQNTIAQQTEAYLQAQVLLGEDVQDFATRLNDLTAFRKSVLIRNGMPKATVEKMSALEAKIWLAVKAEHAKEEALRPRYNGVSGYTDSGDRKAVSLNDF